MRTAQCCSVARTLQRHSGIRVKAEIEHTISAVADERLRLILIARYINCKTFEYIACEMHYSYKQICRLHGKALLRVQNVLECPIASVV